MKNNKVTTAEKLLLRRRFLFSAATSGVGVVWAAEGLALANDAEPQQTCGNVTAADPLYLYASLVSQLQPAAVMAARREEVAAREKLSGNIEQVWILADELKLKLSRQSKIHSTVDKMSTLARIGRTNARAVEEMQGVKAYKPHYAHTATQKLITLELVKVAGDLSEQGEKVLREDEWALLQKLLLVIDDIKTVHQPAAITAQKKFDQFIKTVTTNVLGIQTALMDASRDVVLGNKAAAIAKIKYALDELKSLPSDSQDDTTREGLTRDMFIAMIEPIRALLAGEQKPLPQVSHHRAEPRSVRPWVRITTEEIYLPNAVLQTSTVKAVVEKFIRAGTWWQVVGVTAACLPLWTAYSQTPQRLSLIRSAISAVPRGRGSDLGAAADALNRLTG